ncbi:hypothetical protein AAVH_22496 [Aphelenchoides avenae]|nr:hypothetical protein AAVH_22496 [Aphelenchus avenae]
MSIVLAFQHPFDHCTAVFSLLAFLLFQRLGHCVRDVLTVAGRRPLGFQRRDSALERIELAGESLHGARQCTQFLEQPACAE